MAGKTLSELAGCASGIDRRLFLKLSAAGAGLLATGLRPAHGGHGGGWKVGIGKSFDPYAATMQAIHASNRWPDDRIRGRMVVIKPNLVTPHPPESGVTTDPEVVRALIDRALESGAVGVGIVECAVHGANLSACGYDYLGSYDSRVALFDLAHEPKVLTQMPPGSVYNRLYLPEFLATEDYVLISAAKLKTHYHTEATLSIKNLLGLTPVDFYHHPEDDWRFVMHERGLGQFLVDLCARLPIDFAVVDGVWAMEGEGPVVGDPVFTGMVVAGNNALAVDRACMWAMGLPEWGAVHLSLAAMRNMGPARAADVRIVGAPHRPLRFRRALGLPPLLGAPRAAFPVYRPGVRGDMRIRYWVAPACLTRVEVIVTSDTSIDVSSVRTIHDWETAERGFRVESWDGRDDDGHGVPPGVYTIRVSAAFAEDATIAYATGRLRVV